MPDASRHIELSIVAPAHNEEDNVSQLVREVVEAMAREPHAYELIIVDDGSTDGTASRLESLQADHPQLRVLRMTKTPPGRGNGQSAAFHAGFRAARGDRIAVMDADLQNVPSDVPALLAEMQRTGADMVQGDRSQCRRDTATRRFSSWVGRVFRRTLLGDTIRDTGCSLRVMRREVALALPLQFRGMHRFIPITARQMGFKVVEMPVSHRPRVAGVAKYGMLDRALVGIPDCLAVRWMSRRRRPVEAAEVDRSTGHAPPSTALASAPDPSARPQPIETTT